MNSISSKQKSLVFRTQRISSADETQQNAFVERYNRTVRTEWLGQYIFKSIEEAQDRATRWLWIYNNERPNMALSGITPAMKLKQAA